MKKRPGQKSDGSTAPGLAGEAIMVPGYKQFGARQVEAGAIRNVLAHLGWVAPHTGEPFTEALLFGIGGIGLGYFVYELRGDTALFLATRVTTTENARVGFPQMICKRIGAGTAMQNASTALAAEKKLKQALAEGRPPVVWVDARLLPYAGTPSAYHTLVVYGFDEGQDTVHVADRCDQPLRLTPAELRAARKGEGTAKFRALLVDAPHPVKGPDLQKAVRQGLRDCCEQMQRGFGPANFRSNFGLRALEKWADLLTHPKDKRGWPRFFPAGQRLFDALSSAFDQIENRGSGGSAFRQLYADFLVEAGTLLGQPRFNDVAEQFRACAGLWRQLSVALLPDSVPLFKEARQLTTQKRALFEKKGAAAQDELRALSVRLAEIRTQVRELFPLSADEVADVLVDLREHVLAIHTAEEQAVAALQKLIA